MFSQLKQRLKRIIYPLTVKFGRGSKKAYLYLAKDIPGWVTTEELAQKWDYSFNLPDEPVIVEIGAFLGRSTVVTAGSRRLKRSGIVHVIDPFDASGDEFSVPVYKEIESQLSLSLFEQFEVNIQDAGLNDYVMVHKGYDNTIVCDWNEEIDMLVLDGDQSPTGARRAYEEWIPFLKTGGILIVHNSADRVYEKDHDGHRRVVVESVKEPAFSVVKCVRMTTFAVKK